LAAFSYAVLLTASPTFFIISKLCFEALRACSTIIFVFSKIDETYAAAIALEPTFFRSCILKRTSDKPCFKEAVRV